jgi:glycosyltransferase involved in cell wall biosynthesis
MAIEAPSGNTVLTSMHSPEELELSVVIPAYNEADRIAETIRITVEELRQLGCSYELLVVDDGSKDHTSHCAGLEASEYSQPGHGEIRVITYVRNGGKGHAVRFGAARTRGKFVAFLDADLELHPRLIARLLNVQVSTNADIVIGSKRHPGSVIDYPRERKLYSAVYSFVCRLLFGLPLRDTQTGIKILRGTFAREVLSLLTVNRFAFDLEMLVVAHHLGLKIAEAPVTLTFNRPYGRIGLKDIWGVCTDTMIIWWRLRVSRHSTAWRLGHGRPNSVRKDGEPCP